LTAALAASDGLSAKCFLESQDHLGCLIDGATAATRGVGFAVILFVGTMLTSNYLAGRQSLATPAVLMILVSGIAMSYLPGQFQGYGFTMIIIGVAGAIWVIGKQYILDPGTY
jgi:hypothetical protein